MTQTPHPAERFFSTQHPISTFLKIHSFTFDKNVSRVAFDAPQAFVIDARSGQLHSGLATLVLDTVLGGAVLGILENPAPIATVGLTTQHMRRPVAGEKLICIASVEGVHEGMAHVTGRIVTEDGGEVLSTATGTFMLGTRAKPIGERL